MGELIEYDDWYANLIYDLQKYEFEGIVITRWRQGKRILEDYDKFQKGSGKKIKDIASDMEVSFPEVYRWIEFATKCPDVLSIDKTWSWEYVKRNILPESKESPETPPLPEGKYSVIYADPPWPVGSMVLDKWKSPIEDKYPTMTIGEIASLPIDKITADTCSLFLWATHTFLHEAFHIMEEWGFKYFCTITWNKRGGWTQNGFHKKTEFLLYGYRGTINIEQRGDAIPTYIEMAKGGHSSKPHMVREIIKNKTPEPRIELFAREKADGWNVWGNEANEF